MERLRTVSILAAVALVVAAIGASSASASRFVSDNYPATFTAVNATASTITAGGQTQKCTEDVFESSTIETASASFTPKWHAVTGCGGGSLAHNGCQLTFKPGAETGAGQFAGTVDIGPANCGPMKLKMAVPGCGSILIYPKQNLSATYTNLGSGSTAEVAVALDAGGLKYTVEPFWCGGSGENGSYEATWHVSSSQGGVRVTDAVGVFLAGKASGEPAQQPRFEAEESEVDLLGRESASKPPTIVAGLTASCTGLELSGEASFPTTELSLNATYSGCLTSAGYYTTVKMNSCHYEFAVANVGPPYKGDVDIVCSSEASPIEVRAYVNKSAAESGTPPMCVVKLGSQSGIGTVGYATAGFGPDRGVAVSPTLSGLTYTYIRNTFVCPGAAGTYSNGTYSGDSTLFGQL